MCEGKFHFQGGLDHTSQRARCDYLEEKSSTVAQRIEKLWNSNTCTFYEKRKEERCHHLKWAISQQAQVFRSQAMSWSWSNPSKCPERALTSAKIQG